MNPRVHNLINRNIVESAVMIIVAARNLGWSASGLMRFKVTPDGGGVIGRVGSGGPIGIPVGMTADKPVDTVVMELIFASISSKEADTRSTESRSDMYRYPGT